MRDFGRLEIGMATQACEKSMRRVFKMVAVDEQGNGFSLPRHGKRIIAVAHQTVFRRLAERRHCKKEYKKGKKARWLVHA
jgi:hypothetical protein